MIWIASSRFLKTIAKPSRMWIRSSRFLSSYRSRRVTTSRRKSRKCWRIDFRSSRSGTATSAPAAGSRQVRLTLKLICSGVFLNRYASAASAFEPGRSSSSDPDVVGAQVLDVRQLRDLPLADQLADPLDQGVLLDPVGDRRDQDRVRPLGMRLVGAAELDRPLPGRVDLADLVGRVQDHAAGREVGPVDVLRAASPAAARGCPAARSGALADFLEVMRRDVRRHADGDSRGPVDQQVGELGRQDDPAPRSVEA